MVDVRAVELQDLPRPSKGQGGGFRQPVPSQQQLHRQHVHESWRGSIRCRNHHSKTSYYCWISWRCANGQLSYRGTEWMVLSAQKIAAFLAWRGQ